MGKMRGSYAGGGGYGADGGELLGEAKKRGVRLFGLSDYRLPHVSAFGKVPTLLLGFGCLSEKEMEEGIGIIREIIEQTPKG